MTTTAMRFTDPALEPIWDKVQAGIRVSEAEGVTLITSGDLLGKGRIADWIKQQRHGNQVFFTINHYINPTNECAVKCRFCDFGKPRGDPTVYALSNEEIVSRISPDVAEVHIVGGHHTSWPFSHYVELIASIRAAHPGITIKAYTGAEIDYFTRKFKMTPEAVLRAFKDAGLDAMPGGGAEVFSDRIWKELYPHKAGPDRWLEIHRTAHALGVPTNATLLYGHIETPEERVHHLIRLRDEQDRQPGFVTFIPLAYQPQHEKPLRPRQAYLFEDLSLIATARILLTNFEHIKAFWIDLGLVAASIALHFGASDLDGTLVNELIAHAATAESPAGLSAQRLVDMIQAAGLVPVERDALYRVRKVYQPEAIQQ